MPSFDSQVLKPRPPVVVVEAATPFTSIETIRPPVANYSAAPATTSGMSPEAAPFVPRNGPSHHPMSSFDINLSSGSRRPLSLSSSTKFKHTNPLAPAFIPRTPGVAQSVSPWDSSALDRFSDLSLETTKLRGAANTPPRNRLVDYQVRTTGINSMDNVFGSDIHPSLSR